MGGNLFFAGTGAVLETVGVEIDDALLAGWRARVERARRHLGWDRSTPGSPSAPAIVARRHATGVSLALQAPVDQLFTATELNEWALCATVFERDPVRWASVAADLLADYLEDANDPAEVIPPVLEEHAALARLAVRAACERRPDIVSLIEAASARHVGHLLDEAKLTLGAGKGGQSWALDALPAADTVPWTSLHSIPTAAITGSNGKTTTVRLVAACARAHGWCDGFNCTDGVFIDRKVVASGDYSGPAGTRLVLRNTSVEAAVIETARGGILRRGSRCRPCGRGHRHQHQSRSFRRVRHRRPRRSRGRKAQHRPPARPRGAAGAECRRHTALCQECFAAATTGLAADARLVCAQLRPSGTRAASCPARCDVGRARWAPVAVVRQRANTTWAPSATCR